MVAIEAHGKLFGHRSMHDWSWAVESVIHEAEELNPAGVGKDAMAVDPRSGDERQRFIIDFVQRRIETYNQELGGGVAVRKDRNGYSLIREDVGIPLARLRPIADQGGSFEVLCWSRSSDAGGRSASGASRCKAWTKPSISSPPTRWIAFGHEPNRCVAGSIVSLDAVPPPAVPQPKRGVSQHDEPGPDIDHVEGR